MRLDNTGYKASLEIRKVYQIVFDSEAEAMCHLRIIDELREDYLYPEERFFRVILPAEVQRLFSHA